jgi:AcrR family transcriptional regulator
LGVGVMTIYGYARNKDELLDALTVRVVEDMYDDHVDLDGAPWDDELRAHYGAVRKSLLRHPGLADLLLLRDQAFEFHRRAREQVLGHVERHVSHLHDAGFTPEDAVRYFYGLSYWTVAFVVRESVQDPIAPGPEGAAGGPDHTLATAWVASLPQEFTTLRASGEAMSTLATARQFEFLLETFLAGMRVGLDRFGSAGSRSP